ncbi:DUF1272 domain-containing protein [Qipengyuania sp. 6B39]|uniref:DUF1272 domain-containing protein n=1 Tax=Qipengyuania proteolytica TaxID=2867239 RepID=UPI001C8A52FD|nr:DUF1272 domain-containing protein [Qipengyuania proteolytica]MBX7494296.1 DUF1272 domain-containing protein [Qipengyuania proteolytica]
MLSLKPDCQVCQTPLPPESKAAWICSYECTFCVQCARELDGTCPNCRGELQVRPSRKVAKPPVSVTGHDPHLSMND